MLKTVMQKHWRKTQLWGLHKTQGSSMECLNENPRRANICIFLRQSLGLLGYLGYLTLPNQIPSRVDFAY
jgi:hypothetical protein